MNIPLKFQFSFLFLLLFLCSYGRKTPAITEQRDSCVKYYDQTLKMEVYTHADKWPSPPSGIEKFLVYIHRSVKFYQGDSIQSKFRSSFVVDENGSIKDLKIVDKETKNYSKAEIELLKAISLSPKWEPAKCNGKKVTFLYRFPMTVCYSQ